MTAPLASGTTRGVAWQVDRDGAALTLRFTQPGENVILVSRNRGAINREIDLAGAYLTALRAARRALREEAQATRLRERGRELVGWKVRIEWESWPGVHKYVAGPIGPVFSDEGTLFATRAEALAEWRKWAPCSDRTVTVVCVTRKLRAK